MAALSAGIDTSCSGQDLDNVRVKYLLIAYSAEPTDNFNKSCRDLQLLYQSQRRQFLLEAVYTILITFRYIDVGIQLLKVHFLHVYTLRFMLYLL